MQSPPILELMSQQVADECGQVLAAAKAHAEHIGADARARAVRRREEMLAGVAAETAELERRARERAEAEAEMIVLTTKDTVTNELLGRAERELNRIASQPEFGSVIEALLAELMTEAPANGVVLVPAAHETHCREWLQKNGHGEMEVQARRDLLDGVAVQDKAQTFRITNTLSARFRQMEPSLRKYCITELFGGGA